MTLLDRLPRRIGTPLAAGDLDLRPLTRAVGAELHGVDLTQLTDDAVAPLHAAVRRHGVVFARGQGLGATTLARLAERFGPLGEHPVDQLAGRDRRVSTIVDNATHPPAGFTWHTDLSWTTEPPELGFLAAATIPAVGGDTLWASGAALYDRLGADLRRLCDPLRILHAADATLLASVRAHHGDELADRLVAGHPPISQPLVRVDPTTGRRSLWLSPLYAVAVEGWERTESDALLALLHRRVDDPEVQVRWRWQAGDVAIWDETSTCHRALVDHFPLDREMRRTTTAGPCPLGVADVDGRIG